MNTQTELTQTERVFDENGQTVSETAAAEEVPEVAADAEETAEEAAPAAAAATGKYRIGDRMFATMDEALTYAQSLERNQEATDAYRQGIRDALSERPAAETVTSAAKPEELNTEELYTDPNKYLTKFASRIKAEAVGEIQQVQSTRDADERVWREFTDRHPDLTEFRDEVTALVARSTPEVQGVIRTKGQAAAYDYVATKLKAQFTRHAEAVRPKRQLSNAVTVAPSGTKVETVTPKTDTKKSSTMAEQIRNLRSKRR